MAAGTASSCRTFLRALYARASKLWNWNQRYHCLGGSSGEGLVRRSSSSSSTALSWPVLVALVCFFATIAALFPRAVAFFLPLVASTAAFCLTTHLSAATTEPDSGAAKGAVLVRGAGEPAEAGTLLVCADADATAYRSGGGDGGVQVGCFLRKSATRGVDEDGEEVLFAGRLLVPAPAADAAGALEEELASLQVDRLAEGVWDSYFGRWSSWNHYLDDDACDD